MSYSTKVDHDLPKENRAKSDDDSKSDYDKGHQAAADNAVISSEAMESTFRYSNISPQLPGFNRGYWKSLEKDIRDLTSTYDLVEVFTGALFIPERYEDGKKRISYEVIGRGNIAVPTHFFKVLNLYKGSKIITAAYILPNEEITARTPTLDFSCTVTKIQELSGILFNQWKR